MAKNIIKDGDTLAIDPLATVASGTAVVLGDSVGPIVGVALANGVSGSLTAFQVADAVVQVAKTTGTAWTVGQAIYLKPSTNAGITLASGNLRLGVCVEAAASGASVGKVALYGAAADPAGSSVILEGQGATSASTSAVISVGSAYNGKVVKVFMLTSSAAASVRAAVVASGSLTVTLTGSTTAKFLYQITSTDVA